MLNIYQGFVSGDIEKEKERRILSEILSKGFVFVLILNGVHKAKLLSNLLPVSEY